VALAETYIDESGSHGGSPLLCLAGYVFKRRQAREFTREWGKRLRRERLPFWHTNPAMQGHGKPPFEPEDAWPDERRDKLQRALIKRVREQISFGFAVTVNEAEYNRLIVPNSDLGSAYTFCLRMCLTSVYSWHQRSRFDGQVAYFFESGHASQGEAGENMARVFATPNLREKFAYASHTFADKRRVAPLQAADLLAWHWLTDAKRTRAGVQVSRKDTVALIIGSPVSVMDWTTERLEELAERVRLGTVKIFE
jgi:hypothetical protein